MAILLFLFLQTHPLLAAEQSGLCENLADFACSPGVQDDGTGKSFRFETADDNRLENSVAGVKSGLKNQFENILKNPAQVAFKNLALKALGLIDSPYCQPQVSDQMKRKCDRDTVDGLVSLASKQIIANGDKTNYFCMGCDDDQDPDLEAGAALLQNQTFNAVLTLAQKQIIKNLIHPKEEANIERTLFPQLKDMLMKRISNLPIDDQQKKIMHDKVWAVRFKGTDCEKEAPGLAASFVANAVYHPPPEETFEVCKGLITNSASEFHLVEIIAHELSHSIDPCNISLGVPGKIIAYKNHNKMDLLQEEYPIKGFLACLRSEKSVHAVNFMLNPSSDLSSQSQEAINPFCRSDQITESVADWFATEVMVDYIDAKYPHLNKEQWQIGASNAYRPICSDQPPTANDEHPFIKTRIDALILQNPKLRYKMGCTLPHSKYVYCDAGNSNSKGQKSSATKTNKGSR